MGPGTLLVLLVAGELFSKGLAPIDTGAGPARLAAATCAECHPAAHAEWATSRHGLAWTNAIFQREYRQQPLDWCVHCHAPLREQLTQIRAGGGALADEGVTCAACHIRGGRMLARTRHTKFPHDTEARADFGDPTFCAGCHQFNFPIVETTGKGPGRVVAYSPFSMQDTVAQHARGPVAGTDCLGCHGQSPGRHAFPGGHDADMRARDLGRRLPRGGRPDAVVDQRRRRSQRPDGGSAPARRAEGLACRGSGTPARDDLRAPLRARAGRWQAHGQRHHVARRRDAGGARSCACTG